MSRLTPGRMALAAAGAAFLAAAVAAQQPAAPAAPPPAAPVSEYKNLKILPAGIPRQNLIGVMQMMSTALGVECTFCHVGTTKQTMDFASDAKREKNTTRMMMAMVRRINEEDFKVASFTQSKVTCYTCHRGAPHPPTAPPKPGDKPAPHKHPA